MSTHETRSDPKRVDLELASSTEASLPREFRDLRLGRPNPVLRVRTLGAVRDELTRTSSPWWRVWGLEVALAAGIAACALLLPFSRVSSELGSSSEMPADSIAGAESLETLGFDGLEPYVQFRLALARRHPDPETRYDTDEQFSRSFGRYGSRNHD